MEDVLCRHFVDGDQAGIVDLLRASMARGWADVPAWEWKYRLRPGFDARRVTVATWHGRIVGCLHTTSVGVRSPAGECFQVSLDGDFAVAACVRGAGLAERLHAATHAPIAAGEDLWRGGFTTVALTERFYRPKWGYRTANSRTVELTKTL